MNTIAESILEMNQPFGEFLKHFDSETEAIQYYQGYVDRNFHRLGQDGSLTTCSIIWKRFYNRKRKGLLDYLTRHYFPSSGWKDLQMETMHELPESTYQEIHKHMKIGR